MGPKTNTLLASPEQTLNVATISTVELARLTYGGKVVLSTPVEQWVSAALLTLGAITVELSHKIAAEAYALPEPFHRDPADRIIVATARVLNLRLVTAGQPILDYPHVACWDARR